MSILWLPADLEARISPLIGSPFLAKGDTPSGWDCRGYVRWIYRNVLGHDLPDYRDLYAASIVTRVAGRGERARIIAETLAAQWRPIPPQAGAVAWLEWMGGAGHVGFMLGPRAVTHADTRCGTEAFDLDDPSSAYRLKGAFVPADISEIQIR